MQLSRVSVGFGLAMLLASGAFAQKVSTDYAKDANFATYKTFMWLKDPNATDPLMKQRIIDDVNAALTAKGLKLVTADADVAVAAHCATEKERSLQTFYDGFGGGWRWGGRFGSATTMVNTFEVGTLIVDIFDAKSKEALWRGTATKTISENPEKNAENLNKAVTKMFKEYPPSTRSH